MRRDIFRELKKREAALFLLVFWMCVIFLFSSFPGGSGEYEMPLWLYIERKGAHIFEFFVLALLSWNAFRSFFPRETYRFLFPASAAFTLMYAIIDETHQLFVPGREGKVTDMWFDTAGIILALTLLVFLTRKKRRTTVRLRKSIPKRRAS